MAIKNETKEEIYARLLETTAAEMQIDVSDLGQQILIDLKVLAIELYNLQLLGMQIQKNLYPDLSEETELERDGLITLGRQRNIGEQGVYEVKITGTIGTVIPESTQFVKNNYIYVLDNSHTLVSENDNITIRSLTIGLDSALKVGDTLVAMQPFLDADEEVEVTSIITPPVNPESLESYRADIIQRKSESKNGVSATVLRQWANEVAEVRNIYCYLSKSLKGNINVFVEATKENTQGAITGVPSTETIEKLYKAGNPETGVFVQNPITGEGRRPIFIRNFVMNAIIPVPVDVEITDLSNISYSQQMRDSIDEYLYYIRPFVAGGQSLNEKNDILTEGGVISAILGVLDVYSIFYKSIKIKVSGEIVTSFEFTDGYIPYLRFITNNRSPI